MGNFKMQILDAGAAFGLAATAVANFAAAPRRPASPVVGEWWRRGGPGLGRWGAYVRVFTKYIRYRRFYDAVSFVAGFGEARYPLDSYQCYRVPFNHIVVSLGLIRRFS